MNSIKTFLITTILAVIVLAVFISSIQGYNKSKDAAENLFDAKLADLAFIIAQSEQDQAAGIRSSTIPAHQLQPAGMASSSKLYSGWCTDAVSPLPTRIYAPGRSSNI